MTTQDTDAQEVKKAEAVEEKSARNRNLNDNPNHLYEKVFQKVHFRTDTILCDLGTVTQNSRWFWESYPV